MAVTTGWWEPASRYRVRALIPSLRLLGVECSEVSPAISAYPPRSLWARPAWLAAAIATRLPIAWQSRNTDVVLFQRELVSTLMTLEPLFKRPRVLDVDDAIYLSQRAHSIERIARNCDMVICGNAHLANRFSEWNRNVQILPTGVDTSRFIPATPTNGGQPRTIGWIGTSSNLRYLYSIEKPLERVLNMRPDVTLVVVCDTAPRFSTIHPERVRFVRWTEAVEVSAIQSFTVGVMPLEDDEWARGKCSFKLLQYYACAVPAVASPVGMTAEVLALRRAGVSAATCAEWVESLLALLDNPQDAAMRAATGRGLVEDRFGLEGIARRLASCLGQVASK